MSPLSDADAVLSAETEAQLAAAAAAQLASEQAAEALVEPLMVHLPREIENCLNSRGYRLGTGESAIAARSCLKYIGFFVQQLLADAADAKTGSKKATKQPTKPAEATADAPANVPADDAN